MDSVEPTTAMPYGDSLLAHTTPSELERLHTLEALADPFTLHALSSVPIRPGWRCLEIGAGAGSIARHLAELPDGLKVVATDTDTRFLTDLPAHVQVLHHDLVHDDFPAHSFDLIHVRALLCHLPARNTVLPKIVRWLRPGGWLLVEEPCAHLLDTSPHHPYRRAMDGIERLLAQSIGSDLRWARHLPAHLHDAGLTSISLQTGQVIVGDHSAGDTFTASLLRQASTALLGLGLVDDDDLHATFAYFNAPDCPDLGYTLLSACGTRTTAALPPGHKGV